MSEQASQNYSFQAEVAQLLHLVTHLSILTLRFSYVSLSLMHQMHVISYVLKELIILNIMKMIQTYMYESV